MLLESFQAPVTFDASATEDRPAEQQERCDHDDGLLSTALPLMIGAYALTLAIAAFTFSDTAGAVFVVVISAAYMVAFFSIPVIMARIRNDRDLRWLPVGPERFSDRISIYTGTILRHEAILQMIIVPVVICFGFAAFGIILHFVR